MKMVLTQSSYHYEVGIRKEKYRGAFGQEYTMLACFFTLDQAIRFQKIKDKEGESMVIFVKEEVR